MASISFPTDENLSALLNRQRGAHFWVRGGRLEEVSGLKNRFNYWCHKESEEEAVRDLVAKTLGKLEVFLEERDLGAYRDNFGAAFRKEGAIGRLSKRVFNRNEFSAESPIHFLSMPKNTALLKIGESYIRYSTKDLKDRVSFPISIDLKDKVANENLYTLFLRKKGDVYRVDSEGRLQKSWRLCCTQGSQKKVEQAISQVFQRLSLSNVKNKDDQEVYKIILRCFLRHKGPISRMSTQVFDRSALSGIEGILRPEIEGARRELKEFRAQCKNLESDNGEQLEFLKRVHWLAHQRGQLAETLGLPMRRCADGAGGARISYDINYKPLTVVKPEDEGPHGLNNPSIRSQMRSRFLPGNPAYDGNSDCRSEENAYRASRVLGLNNVPPTTREEKVVSESFNGEKSKECSVQAFVKNEGTLGNYLGLSYWQYYLPRRFLSWYLDTKEVQGKIPQSLVENLAVQIWLTEDIDCHLGNALIHISECEELSFDKINEEFIDDLFKENNYQRLVLAFLKGAKMSDGKKLYLIKHDNGASFPHSHPTWWLPGKFTHLPEVLPQCKNLFTSQTLDLVKNLDTKRKFLEGIVDGEFEGNKARELKEWLTSEDRKVCATNRELARVQKILLGAEERWELLAQYAQEGRSIRELLQLRTQSDYARARSNPGAQ